MLLDQNAAVTLRYNPERCAQRYLPASTFKIINSLIALESGVAPDIQYPLKWDGTHYEIPSWNKDQTMESAFRDSVVWYYQEIARRVEIATIESYVDRIEYGNQIITGAPDSFWLDGDLRISADEQVEFLQRFYRNDLPFSTKTIDAVKEMMLLNVTESSHFSGKTGSVTRVAPYISWFVGYVESDGNVYYFAINIESLQQGGATNGEMAKTICLEILTYLGIIS